MAQRTLSSYERKDAYSIWQLAQAVGYKTIRVHSENVITSYAWLNHANITNERTGHFFRFREDNDPRSMFGSCILLMDNEGTVKNQWSIHK